MAQILARTKGRIIGINPDLMLLASRDDGSTIVTATRTDGVWTITADGVDDATADDRLTAIAAMNEHAKTATGASFYTAQVEPGLSEEP